jgi:hypothetical protein
MDKRFREKLAKIFGMFGSANVSEHEAARRKIDGILALNKKTWNDLTELLQIGKGEEQWRDPDDAAAPPASGNATDTVPNPCDLVYYTLEDYLHFKQQPHDLVATTLWALHTFVFDQFMITPRLALLSPVPGCGKSTLMDLLERLTYQAIKFDDATSAGLYHWIDTQRSTILFDELDNQNLTSNGSMKSVLNSGHKKGGWKLTAGKRFSTFAPAAFGAIGVLPLPLMQRSIVINMERAPRSANLKRFDLTNVDQMQDFSTIYRAVLQWSRQCELHLDPDMPKVLHNRRADNWRVLIAIADACNHGDKARDAAIAMSREHLDEDPVVGLLGDVRKIFDVRKVDRLTSADIVLDLHGLEEAMWSEWRGTPRRPATAPIVARRAIEAAAAISHHPEINLAVRTTSRR